MPRAQKPKTKSQPAATRRAWKTNSPPTQFWGVKETVKPRDAQNEADGLRPYP